MNVNYGHICTALLDIFPAVTNFNSYNSVFKKKKKSCNLNAGVLQIALQI
jgi:hypothetical protein